MAVISKQSDHSRHCNPFSKLICNLVMLSNQLRICRRGFLNLQLSLLFLPWLHFWATLILNVIRLASIRIFLKQKLIITPYIFLTLFFLFSWSLLFMDSSPYLLRSLLSKIYVIIRQTIVTTSMRTNTAIIICL
jgi:hypothetical protein